MSLILDRFLAFQHKVYRAWIFVGVIAFIELDIRKIVSIELQRAIPDAPIQPVLEAIREHFVAQFLLLPFYSIIVIFPMAAFLGRWIQRHLIWLLPIVAVVGFSYFITLEANIGLFLYWYRPGYQEVAFSMTLMPLALLIFFTLDARRIIRVVLAHRQSNSRRKRGH